jgi:TonB-linked SusC/RagA family outer membrane protein
MKLILFLMIAALLQVSAATYAEKVTISAKNVTLEQAFQEIRKQTGYNFLYSDEMIANTKPVSLQFKDANIDDVLKACFKDQPLTFVIKDKNVVVQKKPAPVPEKQSALPPVTVTGTVLDESNQPLPGVTIKEKRTTNGTVTGTKGDFTITVTDRNATLAVSFIGYETQVLSVSSLSKQAIIVLKVSSTNLKEVVVNKGYYNEKRELSTGDVSSVSAKVIAEQPVSNPLAALEGRVPGLYISQSSGIPGGDYSVRLRGQNSIANGNNPLYIVDGVPFTSVSLTSTYFGGGAIAQLSPFNSLNPSDIESIDILKDADATSIYGSRGANGVILITTKKGTAGKTNVNVNVYQGIGQVAHMMDLLNTTPYLAMRHEAFKNDNATPDPNHDFDLLDWDTTRNTDWQKVLIGNTSHLTDAQTSITGGDVNTQFLVSGGYHKESLVFPGDFYDQKGNVHINLNHSSPDQRFHMAVSASYVVDNSVLPTADLTSQINLAPDAPPLYDTNGNLNWAVVNGNATWTNPIAYLGQQANATSNNLIGNLNLSYKILPGLQVASSFGYTNMSMSQSILIPLSSYNPAYSSITDIRSNDFGTNTLKTWIFEPQINYQKKLGEGTLNLLIGSTFQSNNQNSLSQIAYGFSSDALIQNVAAASTTIIGSSSNTIYKYNAFFGRINFDWKQRYLINATARRDGSSRFGPDNQFGNFGSIGAGWVFSKEDFVNKNLSFLSFGKLRASYGTVGNDQLPDYQYLSTYSTYSYNYQGLSGLKPARIANPYFGWEVVKKFEAGLELGFVNDRILLNASYYNNRTGNQLVGYTLPSITGFTTVEANLPAVIQNTGVEIELHSINIKSTDFNWSTSFNLTVPKNVLVSYPDLASSNYANRYVVGQSLFIQKLYHSTGVNPQTGVYTFATGNASGIPSYPQDLQATAPITQKFYGGLQNSFTYKSFQLDFFIQFVKQTGFNYLSYFGGPAGQFGASYGADGNMPTAILARWQNPGDITTIQKFTQNFGSAAASAYFNSFNADNAVTDASFIRLKNVALSYKLPVDWTQKAHLSSARIYLQGQNLFTITKYIGLDPEVQGLRLPPLRLITAGVQIGI